MSDWVAIGSFLAVAFAVVMLVFFFVKARKLMNETHSED